MRLQKHFVPQMSHALQIEPTAGEWVEESR